MKTLKIISIILVFSTIFSVKTFAITDTSSSSIVINADTLEVIYQNNCNEKRSMASTTKIMTGLLLAESGRLDEIITCTDEMVTVEGSAMGLRAGDRISGKDLLVGLMLMSGNDAANVAAYFLGGGIENFAKIMNDKTCELGLLSTNFVTPSGLDADEHYTTAYDLAVLTAHALKNEEFLKTVSSYTATVYFGNPMLKYTIKNHNRLLREYEGAIGVKTGFTKKSGRCLVSAAERNGKRVIVVTLNDPNDWRDHKSLLDYGFEKLTTKTFSAKDYVKTLTVVGGNDDKAEISFDDLSVGVTEESISQLNLNISMPKYVFAPISKGETLGRAEIYFKDKKIAETEIYSLSDISVKEPVYKKMSEKFIYFLILLFKNF